MTPLTAHGKMAGPTCEHISSQCRCTVNWHDQLVPVWPLFKRFGISYCTLSQAWHAAQCQAFRRPLHARLYRGRAEHYAKQHQDTDSSSCLRLQMQRMRCSPSCAAARWKLLEPPLPLSLLERCCRVISLGSMRPLPLHCT